MQTSDTEQLVKDDFAVWPSRHHGGVVVLDNDGTFLLPGGYTGQLCTGEQIAIDPNYPLFAVWDGQCWTYKRAR